VPLAIWPLHAEQFLKEVFIVDVLRVGATTTTFAKVGRDSMLGALLH
jgi:hypothetical protein